MSDESDSVEFRPPSDNLVDLHISIVPMEHWVERLNYASHKVIGDTFSVGFVRVVPETPISALRIEMKEQLGKNFFPEDYVFLKHVGRCLALVRQHQERQLKVKHFLPPQSAMPEIFVLPGQPTMYTYTVLPPIQPRQRDLHKPYSDNDSILEDNQQFRTSWNGSLPNMQSHAFAEHYPPSHTLNISTQSPREQARSRKTNTALNKSFNSDSSNLPALQSRASNSLKKTKKQKRHVSGKSHESAANHALRNVPHEKRGRTTPGQAFDGDHADRSSEIRELLQNKTHESSVRAPAGQRNGPGEPKSVLLEGPQKHQVRYNMPSQSSSNASSQGSIVVESRRRSEVEMKPATNSTNGDSGFTERDRSESEDSSSSELRRTNEDLARFRRDSETGALFSLEPSSPSTESPLAINRDRNQLQKAASPDRTPRHTKAPAGRSHASGPAARGPESTDKRKISKNQHQQQHQQQQQQPQQQQPQQPVQSPPADHTEESDGTSKTVERERLWEELMAARNSRRTAEKERQELVKRAKATTSKMNQKRISVRDSWKKKFFEEKKKTMPLEEICRRLQNELNSSHQRLVSAMEGGKKAESKKAPSFLPRVVNRPSIKSNSKIHVTRLQHDMDTLRRKIEDAKIKLTGEIKLRHQAEQDVKIVRQELLTKKIRAHIAYQEAIRSNRFSIKT